MAGPDKTALSSQIRNDPRVQAYIQQKLRQRYPNARPGAYSGEVGGIAVDLNAQELAQLGYHVPADWEFRWGGRNSQGGVLFDNRDWGDTVAETGAGAIATFGASDIIKSIANGASHTQSTPMPSDGTDTIYGDGVPLGAANPGTTTSGLSDGLLNTVTQQGGNALTRFLGDNWQQLLGLGIAGGNAIRGLTQGPTQAEQDLSRILKLAEGRITSSEPLFNALQSYALSSMPKYTRGEQ